MGKIIRNGITYGGTSNSAGNISYNNTTSGLNSVTVQNAITELKSLFDNSEHVTMKIVQELPLVSEAEDNVIYLIDEDQNDIYEMYIIAEVEGVRQYINIGDTEVDLSDYLKQVIELPTAGASEVGNIYQYKGATTANYAHGYIYECVSDGGATPAYSWEEVPTFEVPESVGRFEYDLNNEVLGEYFNLYEDIVDESTGTTIAHRNQATGLYSRASGMGTTASGNNSEASGYKSVASGQNAHAHGNQTIANSTDMTAIGRYNLADTADAEVGENLIVTSTVSPNTYIDNTEAAILNNGIVVSNDSNLSTTDYIDLQISGLSKLVLSGCAGHDKDGNTFYSYAFYDSSKQYTSIQKVTATEGADFSVEIDVPAGARYFRLSAILDSGTLVDTQVPDLENGGYIKALSPIQVTGESGISDYTTLNGGIYWGTGSSNPNAAKILYIYNVDLGFIMAGGYYIHNNVLSYVHDVNQYKYTGETVSGISFSAADTGDRTFKALDITHTGYVVGDTLYGYKFNDPTIVAAAMGVKPFDPELTGTEIANALSGSEYWVWTRLNSVPYVKAKTVADPHLFVIGNGTSDANRSNIVEVNSSSLNINGDLYQNGDLFVSGTPHFVGTSLEWEALTAAEKAKYEDGDVVFTDDNSGTGIVENTIVDTINPISAHAVYEYVQNRPNTIGADLTVPVTPSGGNSYYAGRIKKDGEKCFRYRKILWFGEEGGSHATDVYNRCPTSTYVMESYAELPKELRTIVNQSLNSYATSPMRHIVSFYAACLPTEEVPIPGAPVRIINICPSEATFTVPGDNTVYIRPMIVFEIGHSYNDPSSANGFSGPVLVDIVFNNFQA